MTSNFFFKQFVADVLHFIRCYRTLRLGLAFLLHVSEIWSWNWLSWHVFWGHPDFLQKIETRKLYYRSGHDHFLLDSFRFIIH